MSKDNKQNNAAKSDNILREKTEEIGRLANQMGLSIMMSVGNMEAHEGATAVHVIDQEEAWKTIPLLLGSMLQNLLGRHPELAIVVLEALKKAPTFANLKKV